MAAHRRNAWCGAGDGAARGDPAGGSEARGSQVRLCPETKPNAPKSEPLKYTSAPISTLKRLNLGLSGLYGATHAGTEGLYGATHA
eukprot:2651795-Rhodomonas_salina.1